MGSAGEGGINWHFFFLGAAFMLLEFQNVSKSALLFGSTWMVNAYIISAILVLILLANICAYYFPIKNTLPVYIILLASVLMVYFIPLDIFNNFGYPAKSILALAHPQYPDIFCRTHLYYIIQQCRTPGPGLWLKPHGCGPWRAAGAAFFCNGNKSAAAGSIAPVCPVISFLRAKPQAADLKDKRTKQHYFLRRT